jgi:hypothetical protein
MLRDVSKEMDKKANNNDDEDCARPQSQQKKTKNKSTLSTPGNDIVCT